MTALAASLRASEQVRSLYAHAFSTTPKDTYYVRGLEHDSIPPFSCAFGKQASFNLYFIFLDIFIGYQQETPYFVVADEMGLLHFLDFFRREYEKGIPILFHFQMAYYFSMVIDVLQMRAHYNAILDLAWSNDDKFLVASSTILRLLKYL
jgi:hypothetical protein